MSLKVEIVDVKSQPAATITLKTSQATIPDDLGRAYGALHAYLQKTGVPFAGPPFALYRDVSGPEWTVVAGFPVAKLVEGEGEIEAGETPGGQAAMTWHTGPYDKLAETWNGFDAWFKAMGHDRSGLAWESYVSDPDTTAPSELKTQLFWHI
jgi:effector-binding domain-containing protein